MAGRESRSRGRARSDSSESDVSNISSNLGVMALSDNGSSASGSGSASLAVRSPLARGRQVPGLSVESETVNAAVDPFDRSFHEGRRGFVRVPHEAQRPDNRTSSNEEGQRSRGQWPSQPLLDSDEDSDGLNDEARTPKRESFWTSDARTPSSLTHSVSRSLERHVPVGEQRHATSTHLADETLQDPAILYARPAPTSSTNRTSQAADQSYRTDPALLRLQAPYSEVGFLSDRYRGSGTVLQTPSSTDAPPSSTRPSNPYQWREGLPSYEAGHQSRYGVVGQTRNQSRSLTYEPPRDSVGRYYGERAVDRWR